MLSGGCSRFAVNDGSAFGDSIIRKAIRHTAINSKTPRTKARRLVCNGGYSRFAVNDGLRFANPSYELIRLTALIHPTELIRLTGLTKDVKAVDLSMRLAL